MKKKRGDGKGGRLGKAALLQMQRGTLTAQELGYKCLQRLQLIKPFNIFSSEIQHDVLLEAAQSSSQIFQKGAQKRLQGIPLAFKDNFCTQNFPTTCGSKMLHNYDPPYDATMVYKCKNEGAVVIGKTNMDEFAMGSGSLDSCHGPVVNPWSLVASPSLENRSQDASDSEVVLHDSKISNKVKDGNIEMHDWYISGGSSGGSAAAVASGACLGAFGSDTGGSTRIPAGYCGIVGLKPTYGLLSRHGLIPLVNSMDVPGILTQTVEDCALILDAVAGHDLCDSTTVPDAFGPYSVKHDLHVSQFHFGIPKEFNVPGLSEEVVSAWREIADCLEKAGAKVSQVSMPNAQLSRISYHVLCCCEVASNFSRYDGIEFGLRCGSEESTEELYAENRHQGFNDVVRGRILAGNFFLLKRNYAKFFLKAQRVRRLISNDFRDVFAQGIDFLLTPTTLTDAPRFSWFQKQDNRTRCEEQDIFTTAANMAGVPAMSLPVKISEKGLPISLQVTGPHFSENSILSAASWIEKEVQFPYLNLDFLHSQTN